ncbi:MAG: hypothetical protein GF355_17545 [Candidatus Eisenbacteria bacterium]|nr:hypothetical protein [Candidatus Eisenbacteria bacterium]
MIRTTPQGAFIGVRRVRLRKRTEKGPPQDDRPALHIPCSAAIPPLDCLRPSGHAARLGRQGSGAVPRPLGRWIPPGRSARVQAPAGRQLQRSTMSRSALAAILLLAVIGGVASQDRMNRDETAAQLRHGFGEIATLWQQEDYATAIEVLNRLAALPGVQEFQEAWRGIHYNLACAFALLGQTEESVASLQDAVEAGYSNVDHLASDPDLEAIRSDPRYAAIVSELRAVYPRWESPVFQTPYGEDLSLDEKVAGLARVWAEIRYAFVHRHKVTELDWDRLFVATLAEIRETRSTAEYYRILQKTCAQLGDGHTSVNVPGELFRQMYSRPSIDTRLLDERVYVVSVLDDSLVDEGLRPGLEVLTVDGIPVHEYAQTYIAPYHSASTPQGAAVGTYSFYLLCGAPGDEVDLELRAAGGESKQISLARDFHRILSYESSIESRLLDGNLGYVALNTFADRSMIAAFDSVLAELRETDGLILDLRRNTGGNGDVAYDILAYLTAEPFPITRSRVRTYNPLARAQGRRQSWNERSPDAWEPAGDHPYTGGVAVLIGPQTGSAAEDFVAAFAALHRGVLVGAPTAGSTGQPLVYRLPGGGSGIVCTADVIGPDGREFVGLGIQPDIEARTTVEDLRAGRDAALEAALAVLQTRPGSMVRDPAAD